MRRQAARLGRSKFALLWKKGFFGSASTSRFIRCSSVSESCSSHWYSFRCTPSASVNLQKGCDDYTSRERAKGMHSSGMPLVFLPLAQP